MLTLIIIALVAIAAALVYVMVVILGFGLFWAVAAAVPLVTIGGRRARLWDERRRPALAFPMGNEPEATGPIRRTGHRLADLGRRRYLPLIALAIVVLPAVVGVLVDSEYWNAVLVVTIAFAVIVSALIMLRRAAS